EREGAEVDRVPVLELAVLAATRGPNRTCDERLGHDHLLVLGRTSALADRSRSGSGLRSGPTDGLRSASPRCAKLAPRCASADIRRPPCAGKRQYTAAR